MSEMKKSDLIVITGGGGFIGGSLAAYFKEKGFTRIRAVDKKPLPDWYQVIDGVENTYAKAPAGVAELVRFVGNVPVKPPEGGLLRHKGWRAARVDLPALRAGQDAAVIAPAELEVE